MGWTSPHTYASLDVVTAAELNETRDNLNDLDRRTTPGYGTVATSEGTASGSYTNLATTGPSATVTIGTSGLALVIITATMTNSTAACFSIMSFAVSGATTVAATDSRSLQQQEPAHVGMSSAYLVSGLTAGSNTFTAKYRQGSGGTANFQDRNIVVIPLGS